jgi:serine phosphatase RsbU (regulator of sigma subunit)
MPLLDGWQIAPYYQPAREVGGDFYDIFELEDGRLGVVEGDATGKGMPAALVASATSSMLRAVAQAFVGSTHPSKHVRDLLLRHTRAQERYLELRQRGSQPALPLARWRRCGTEG